MRGNVFGLFLIFALFAGAAIIGNSAGFQGSGACPRHPRMRPGTLLRPKR